MFLSARRATPFLGKQDMAIERIRAAAGIISRNGASDVWMQKVLGGCHKTGTIILHAVFESMEHSMQVGKSMMTDPAWSKLMMEREMNPAAEIVGPELFRRVAGDDGKDEYESTMVREYALPRENLSNAIAMVPNIETMFSEHDVTVSMWSPVIAEDMQRIYVAYSGVDIVAIGKAVDQVGLSKEFQAMLVDASKLGTLDRSWMMTSVK